jgi:Sec-independent protein translocase protein TatA
MISVPNQGPSVPAHMQTVAAIDAGLLLGAAAIDATVRAAKALLEKLRSEQDQTQEVTKQQEQDKAAKHTQQAEQEQALKQETQQQAERAQQESR